MSDTAFPNNGGWQFRQSQTGWVNPAAMIGKSASIQAILKHRLANPAITAKHQLSTDPEQIERELVQFQQARGSLPTPAVLPSFFQPGRSPLPSSGGEDAAATPSWFHRLTRLGTGIRTMADWLPDGKAVPPEVSEQRAAICVTCPKHKTGNWLDLFVAPVAALLKKQLEEREQMKLSTSRDGQLNFCDACGCPLKTKVHIPIEVIRRHMKQPEKDRLDARCWILREP